MNLLPSPIVAAYCQGFFGADGQAYVERVKRSGFNTVVLALGHVHYRDSKPDTYYGDVYYNNTEIVANGSYVGPAGWAGLIEQLKQGPDAVERVLFSIGGWGVGDFANIERLIAEFGTGPQSPLYRNFLALKQLFPAIDAIDLDNEEGLDQASMVAFCRMLGAIGFQVTFCPYNDQAGWIDCLAELESSDPGLVVGFNLQCYAGGGGNDPADWIRALRARLGTGFPASFVIPGVDTGGGPAQVRAQFAGWAGDGIGGGFLWTFEGAGPQPRDYARAIAAGLGADASAAA